MIIVVTVSNRLFILDALCHCFNVILPNQWDTAMRQKTLRLRPGKSIGAPLDSSTAELPISFKLRGTQAQANSMGLPMVTS